MSNFLKRQRKGSWPPTWLWRFEFGFIKWVDLDKEESLSLKLLLNSMHSLKFRKPTWSRQQLEARVKIDWYKLFSNCKLFVIFSFNHYVPVGLVAAVRWVQLLHVPWLQVQVHSGFRVHSKVEAQCGPYCGNALWL